MTKPRPHRCNIRCACPVHHTQLLYNQHHDEHACQDRDCVYAHGMNPPTTWTCTNQILATDMTIRDWQERQDNPVQRECGYTIAVESPVDLPLNRDRHLADCPAVLP